MIKYFGIELFDKHDTLLGISTMNGLAEVSEDGRILILPPDVTDEGEPVTMIKLGLVLINITLII